MLAALVVTGCHRGDAKPKAKATPSPSVTATATAAPTATPTPEPRAAAIPPQALKRAAKLPVEQRVGQLFVVGFEGIDLQAPVFRALAGHGWGGIYVGPDNAFDLTGVGLFAGEAAAVAKIPPLVMSFADGRPEKLGSSRAEARAAAASAAAAARAAGVTLTSAPFVDVGLDADPKQIAQIAPGAVRGWLDGGVAPAPAHFPGQGVVTQDPLDGPANVGLPAEDLRRRDLRPFATALRRAPAVTVSSASFTAYDPVTPAALTPAIVRGLLRRDLRFGGVAMTDDLAGLVAATGGTAERAAAEAIRTGIDLVLVPDPAQAEAVYTAVLRAVKQGRIPRARVRDAAARVLALKSSLR